jgi:hypothetical protein
MSNTKNSAEQVNASKHVSKSGNDRTKRLWLVVTLVVTVVALLFLYGNEHL